ncbi:MAG: hypothetical protein Q4E32_07715 [Bacteroidales bacterium]|nr:hypothetical protein [Bacteroidales bacterium]
MKRITSLVLTAVLALCGTTAFAQNTYTVLSEINLANGNFAADEPVDRLVRTYAKDMQDDGKGAGGAEMYGMQPVTGWTASRPTDNLKAADSAVGGDAAAAGVYPYVVEDPEAIDETRPGLGGTFYPPYASSDVSGNCFGFTAVWNQDVQYTQPLSLPAGAYMITMKYINVGSGTTPNKNLFGFIVSDSERYMSKKTSYPVGMIYDALSDSYSYEWSTDTILFQIDAAKTGNLSLGFTIGNVGTAGTLHMFVDNVRVYQIDPNDLIRDEINAKKVELLRLIEIGTAYGVDTSASQAVYDDPRASMQDVLDAIANQQAINESGTTDFSEYFIQNPHFTMDDPVDSQIYTYARDMDGQNGGSGVGGWGIAEGGSMRFGSQHITGWNTFNETDNKWRSKSAGDGPLDGRASGIFEVGSAHWLGGTAYLPPTTMSDGSTEGKVLGMVGCWGNKIQYTQYVTIPAGKYILSISYYNSGGTVSIPKNLIGFITDDGTEYLCTNKTFPVGRWSTEEIEFELAEETSGNFSMGYETAGASSGMPHFFIDGISLIYIGTGVNVSLEALKAAVRNAKNVMDNNEFYTGLREQLQSAVNAGQALIDNNSSDNDANKAATAAIANLMPDVQANLDAYARLDTYYNKPEGKLYQANEKYYDDEIYPNTVNAVGTLSDDVDSALKNHTASTADIEGMIAKLEPSFTFTDELQQDWEAYKASTHTEPINISDLFTTLGVTYSTTALQGANVPDKQWNYGNATNFKTQYGTMEVWNQSPFEVKQTLTEIPAGTYSIRTRGFYRTADNATNYLNYNPEDDRAYVFANYSKTALTNSASFASAEKHETWAETSEGSGIYVPNSQNDAYTLFTNPDFDPVVQKEAKTTLPEGGDITLGVCTEQMDANSWVVWYTFELLYTNTSNADLADEIQSLMETVYDLMDTDCQNIADTYNNLSVAYDEGDAALRTTDMQKRKDAYKALKDAIDDGNEALAALDQLEQEAKFYEELSSKYNYESTSTQIYDLIEGILDIIPAYDDIADVNTKKDALRPAWDKHVLGQAMAGATEDEPVDITGIILNPDFELLNTKYWSQDEGIGTNVGYQNNATYKNADGVTVIEHFMEAWVTAANGPLNDGKMRQTIPTPLPAGYYQLEADAFAVNQDGLPDGGLKGIYLWATDGVNKFVTPITVADDNETVAKHFTVDILSDGVTPMTVGISISQTNANWYVADNFTLKFVGTTPPDGIADIAEAGVETLKDIYTLTGIKTNRLQKGINIVVDQNGNTRKVFVK